MKKRKPVYVHWAKVGGFSAVPNQLLERMGHQMMGPKDWRLLVIIWRKTIGYQKQACEASLTYLAAATGLNKASACRARQNLVKHDLISVQGDIVTLLSVPAMPKPQLSLLTPGVLSEPTTEPLSDLPPNKDIPTKIPHKERGQPEAFEDSGGGIFALQPQQPEEPKPMRMKEALAKFPHLRKAAGRP